MFILYTLIILAILIFLILPVTLVFFVQHKSKLFVVPPIKPGHVLYEDSQAFLAAQKETWTIKTNDHLTLEAWYLPASQPSHKTVITANGYHGSRIAFAAFGWLFHKLGYNVLMPAYRASAEAQGHWIGFGWLDKDDYKLWCEEVLRHDAAAELAMFGISMGAATSLMMAGDELPEQVKCFISDCAFDDLEQELKFKARQDYHLPAGIANFMIPIMSRYSARLAGYGYKEASAVKQLANNQRPILFIHGEADDFVPTEMVHGLYEATQGEKELYLVPEAGHAQAYETDLTTYRKKVEKFLQTYL